MGAAGSIEGQIGIKDFKLLREEYESKLKAGVSDTELYDHMSTLIVKITNQTTTPTSSSSSSSSPSSSSSDNNNNLSIDLINQSNENNNCSEIIKERIKLNLLLKPEHKLSLVKSKLETILKQELQKLGITTVEEKNFTSPLVTAEQNFDSLLISTNHYCRRSSDVYYVTNNILLRTHLTAYLYETLLNKNINCYYTSGPVFRRIEEDSIHSELSHQFEFVHIVDSVTDSTIEIVSSIVKNILPSDSKLRWEESDEMPYITDSMSSLETLYKDSPIEIARYGVLSPEMLEKLQQTNRSGYLIMFDLDHIAMILNSISTIREIQV